MAQTQQSSRPMPEQVQKAVGTILEAGFQVEADAFKAMLELPGNALDRLVIEVLKLSNASTPRPISINKDLVLRAAKSLDLIPETVALPLTGLGHQRRFAEDIESRLEIVSDPSGKLGTTGAFDDFLHYFRNRFDKMSTLFKQ